MVQKSYPQTTQKVRDVELTRWTYEAFGTIVRACAEMEDIIDHYLCRLSGLDYADLVLLLGRTAVSSKLDLIDQYIKRFDVPDDSIYNEFFKGEGPVRQSFSFRNIVAHGWLIGVTEEGKLAFRTTSGVAIVGKTTVAQDVVAHSEEDIWNNAEMISDCAKRLEEKVDLRELRREYRDRLLQPHRKGRPKGDSPAKKKRPRRPSE